MKAQGEKKRRVSGGWTGDARALRLDAPKINGRAPLESPRGLRVLGAAKPRMRPAVAPPPTSACQLLFLIFFPSHCHCCSSVTTFLVLPGILLFSLFRLSLAFAWRVCLSFSLMIVSLLVYQHLYLTQESH